MLRKSRRLTAREVRLVLARGRGKRGGPLSVKRLSVPGSSKAAVVVSRKVAKNAVMRNELRRALYGGLRTLPFPDTHLVVFLERLPAEKSEKARNEGLFLELEALLKT